MKKFSTNAYTKNLSEITKLIPILDQYRVLFESEIFRLLNSHKLALLDSLGNPLVKIANDCCRHGLERLCLHHISFKVLIALKSHDFSTWY